MKEPDFEVDSNSVLVELFEPIVLVVQLEHFEVAATYLELYLLASEQLELDSIKRAGLEEFTFHPTFELAGQLEYFVFFQFFGVLIYQFSV